MVNRFVPTLLSSVVLATYSHICAANIEHDIASGYDQAVQFGQQRLPEGYLENLIKQNQALSHSSLMPASEENQYSKVDEPIVYKILISDAMGEREIKRLFRALSHREDVVFVLRGLLPTEKTITDVGRRIVNMLKETEVQVNVQLDPRPFNRVDAEYAPQILAFQGEQLLVSAKGLTNPNYIAEQLSQGKEGDLGSFGDTVKISERDITDVLRERVEKLDEKELIAGAKARYWDNVRFLELPKAQVTQERVFEPVITMNRDIVAPDGTVIAYQGQRANPLQHPMPFTMRLVIFDATDQAQIEFVKALPESRLRTKYITTKYDKKLKWDAVKHVERQLNAPVYQLNSDIINSFNLHVVPSVVTANNDEDYYLISEHYLPRHVEVVQ
jgi:conjugal transfer pilus assembly protein TraW